MAPPTETTHLFIDTNVFLSFYSFNRDDIEELRKVVGLIKFGRIKLYLPQQVAQEFYRRRDEKLAEALRSFEGTQAGPVALPRFMSELSEARAYHKAGEQMQQARAALLKKARENAESQTLAADTLFAGLRDVAGLILTEDAVFDAALRRMRLGNPPGKDRSLGDRINWETLLKTVPKGVHLHVVSKDSDYQSKLTPARAHLYLAEEWKNKQQSKLTLHTELKPFLAERFPEIKLSVDVEKRAAIDALKHSGSFAQTHKAVAGIGPFIDVLTDDDAVELADTALSNPEIYLISSDSDVAHLFKVLLGDRLALFDANRRQQLEGMFGLGAQIAYEEDDLPF